MQQCISLIINENLNLLELEIENMKKMIKEIDNLIQKRLKESIKEFKQFKANSSLKDLNKSLESLKKVEGIIAHIKQLQTSKQQVPSYCDKELEETIKDLKTFNYEKEYELAQQFVLKETQNLLQSWKKDDYQTFAQIFKNLKELKGEDQNKLMKKDYSSLKDFYEKEIYKQSQFIVQLIDNEKWGQQLCKQVDILQDQLKELVNTDIYFKVEQSKETKINKLKIKLDQKYIQFLKETSTEKKCDLLVNLRKICYEVPAFEDLVKNKIIQCLNSLNSSDYQTQILNLSDALSNNKEPVAELILKETQHFSSFNTKNFQEKVQNQHNPDYVNKNLKNLNILTKQVQPLHEDEQLKLKTRYLAYEKKFQKIVDSYLKNISQIHQLKDSILRFSEQKNFNLDSWSQKSKDDCTDLLAQVCSYWTLSIFQEDSIQPDKGRVYKKLHASQIFSIMILLGFENQFTNEKLGSQLIQILTGEGKSIVLGILSTLLALLGYKVDVACYSKHLSDRDYNDFEKFFDSLKVKNKIKFGTFTDLCDDKINDQGDIRKLSQDLLQGNYLNTLVITQEKSILLIDEVDVFFSDSFYGQTYNPCCLFKSKDIFNLMNKIWKSRELTKLELTDMIFKENDFLEIIKEYPQMQRLFRIHFKSMVDAAVAIKDHQYIFQDEKIGYQQHDSISFTTINGYSTSFAYFQEMEKGNLTEEQVEEICGINLQCGHFSYSQLPKLYQKILGVTGTLETLNQECLNIVKEYTQKATIIPSMFGSTNLDDDLAFFFIAFDEEQFFLDIIQNADMHLQNEQPVLIFFKDNAILEKFEEIYASKYKEKCQILNQKTRYIKATVDKACRKGYLTLCERAFGRGSDFYSSNKEINKQGGVVVIQAFFSEDISEEKQIKGRTARQSNKGKYIQIVQATDVEETLHIQVNQLKEKSSQKRDLYYQLDKKRKQLFSEKVKLLNQSIAKAQLDHEETIKYSEYLRTNKKEDALKMLIQFNSGKQIESQSEKIHFILLLDDSGSMKALDGTHDTRWKRLIDSVNTFILERSNNSMKEEDIISVVYHSCSSLTIAKYENLSNISSILDRNQPRYGGNAFYRAIDEATKILDNEPKEFQSMKKVVMFLSDGRDCASKQFLINSLDNFKAKYKNSILGFWCIGFGPRAETGILKEMTQKMNECGGQYKTAMNLVELKKNFSELASIESIMTMKK